MDEGYKYGKLQCNLCWKELQAPYIVTSCNHCFCMEHENDQRIQQSSCPGCAKHLPSKGGLTRAVYACEKSESSALNGMRPDSVLQLASKAIDFWVSQERTGAEYQKHMYLKLKQNRTNDKENYEQLTAELTVQLNSARGAAQQGEAEKDEMRAENRLLQEKYQEEARKVRMLQERMVEWKRKRGGGESPSCQGSPQGDGVLGSHLDGCGQLPQSMAAMAGMLSPTRGGGSVMGSVHGGSVHGASRRASSALGYVSGSGGGGGGYGGSMSAQRPSSAWGSGHDSPNPSRASYDAPRLGSPQIGMGGGGQQLGGGPFGAGGPGSRHGTPIQRSASFQRSLGGPQRYPDQPMGSGPGGQRGGLGGGNLFRRR